MNEAEFRNRTAPGHRTEASAETHPGAAVDISAREIGWRNGIANAWRSCEHAKTADECRTAIAALGNAGPRGVTKIAPIAHPDPDLPDPKRMDRLMAKADLEKIAQQFDRLSPDRRDPERFHVDRSEIVAELRRLARTVETHS